MKPEAWTVPADLIEDIGQFAKEAGCSRRLAIEHLIRLGLMASEQTHMEYRFREQK